MIITVEPALSCKEGTLKMSTINRRTALQAAMLALAAAGCRQIRETVVPKTATSLPPTGTPQVPIATETPTTASTTSPTPTETATPEVWSPSVAVHATQLGSIGYGDLTDAAWSPNGKIIAISSRTSIRFYETDNFYDVQTMGIGGAYFVAFSPTDAVLAALKRQELVIFSLANQLSMTMPITTDFYYPSGLVFSPDGKSIITCGWADAGDGIHIWDTATGSLLQTFGMPSDATSLAINPDGTQFAVGSRNGEVKVWDITNGFASRSLQIGLVDPNGWITGMAYRPNGQQLAIENHDQVRVCDPLSGSMISDLLAGGQVYAIAYSPDGQLLAFGGENSLIYLVNPDTGDTVRTLDNPRGQITTLRFSPDGSKILSLSDDEGVRFWDVASGNLLQTLDGYSDGIFSLAFTPDGRNLFFGDRLGGLQMWDVASQTLTATLLERSKNEDSDWIHSLTISADGQLMASATSSLISIWNLSKRKQLRVLKGHEALITDLVFTPDNKTLISTSGDGTIRLWDTNTGKERIVLRGHERGVEGAALTNDGEFVTVGDQTVRFWSWKTGNALGVLRREDLTQADTLLNVKVNPQTKFAAVMDTFHVQIWDAAGDQWNLLHEFATGIGLDGMSFDPSGSLLAFGSDSGLLRVMDTASGEILITLEPEVEDNIQQVSFSPDGRLLAASYLNGEIKLWGVNRIA
jgi:WD40 repeat protein